MVVKDYNVNPYSVEKSIHYAIDFSYDKSPKKLK